MFGLAWTGRLVWCTEGVCITVELGWIKLESLHGLETREYQQHQGTYMCDDDLPVEWGLGSWWNGEWESKYHDKVVFLTF